MPAVVPVSASIEHQFVGTLRDDRIMVTLHEGHVSDGFKSDFQRRPARWVVWERFDPKGKRIRHVSMRYGGKNYAKGLAEFELARTQLREAGVEEVCANA